MNAIWNHSSILPSIQETKISIMNDVLAKSLWCNVEIGFSFSNSVGRSGGLITLWRKDKMEVLLSFKGEGFLGIKVCWKEELYYIVNVYSSCDLNKKKVIWDNILNLKEAFRDGEWIIGGDFKSIKNVRERKGRAGEANKREADLFAEFICKSALVDIPCNGKKFTWFSGDGKSMSRIDRFLLSYNVVNIWDVSGQMIGERDISDHCPIWIMTDKYNWGAKPFKFNNEWFTFDSFLPFVEKEWLSLKVEGRGDFVLKEKLKLLKDKLKRWNREVFGKINLDIEEDVNDINLADERLASTSFSLASFEENLVFRKEATCGFWRNLRIKENMLVQKSRMKWLKEGDTNSGFFHKVMKQRRIHNHIGPILTSGGMVESVEEVREEVFKHFGNKFVEPEVTRPVLDGVYFNTLSREEARGLEKPFL
ncbi:uncharacterized protein LOC131623108 [Vicia villosa]|uniref:uncharacterized protein LOC131623108 n=1 Tax=Vicia villosa TaxID=3911 RepID=UPI00273B47F7|nr:uncharacterized protein LOC131623108 [Vicia villosa]